jgi:arylsulfatase A
MFDVLPTAAKLAGAKMPDDRTIDGADIWPHLAGEENARPAHETFYYFRGLRLEAVRHGDWKLQIAPPNRRNAADDMAFAAKLYNLKNDIGEAKDVAAQHPEIVARLRRLIDAMDKDLGVDGRGPGCRPLGKVSDARPLIDMEGRIRDGFE